MVQSIIHTNIDKLGHMYGRFEPRPAKLMPVPSIPLNTERIRTPPIVAAEREQMPITERLMNHANSDSGVVIL